MSASVDKGTASLFFLASFMSAIALWRNSTAQFLRSHGEESEVGVPTLVIEVFWDFFRAIAIGVEGPDRPPLGVWLHGVMLAVSVFGLFAYLAAAN